MATAITVDAHAGWPVQVILLEGEPDRPKKSRVEVIPALSKHIFYIHSGLQILSISELERND